MVVQRRDGEVEDPVEQGVVVGLDLRWGKVEADGFVEQCPAGIVVVVAEVIAAVDPHHHACRAVSGNGEKEDERGQPGGRAAG